MIILHTTPFAYPTIKIGADLSLSTLIVNLSRFAVPFFFIISGFFWLKKLDASPSINLLLLNLFNRFAFLLLLWSLIYLIISVLQSSSINEPQKFVKVFYWEILGLLKAPLLFILQGSKSHLWFLTSLLLCAVISCVLVRRKLIKELFIIAIVFYIVGVLGKAYSETPIGFLSQFNFRNGPFFGLIFFVTGMALYRTNLTAVKVQHGVLLVCFGFIFQLLEVLYLNKYYGTSMNQDFTIGTYFFGVGVSLIAINNPRLLQINCISKLGSCVLGVYLIHYIFVDLLKPIDLYFYNSSVIWEISYPLLVLFLSVVMVKFISRLKISQVIFK